VLLAVVAVLVTGTTPVPDGVLALLLLPVGAWWSHRRRTDDNLLLKCFLAGAAGVGLWRFFGDLGLAGSVDAARTPLTQLFLAVQVLHGADLPQRRDLGFTLASSLALVALAGSGVQDGAYGLLLLAYGVLAGLALVRLQRSAAREHADRLAERVGGLARAVPAPPAPPTPPGAARVRAALRAIVPALAVTALVFSLLPSTSRSRLQGLPFAGLPGPELPAAGVTNPGLPYAERDGQAAPVPEGEYFGFAETVDLSVAPQLSDAPVLRVRADRPRLLRGVVLDRYDGRGWSRSATEPPPRRGLPVTLAPPPRPAADLVEHVTTVEVLRETPNLVFAPAEPTTVWLSAGAVTAWDDGTVTTPATLGEGTVYSVISLLDSAPASALRAAPAAREPPGGAQRWLQLPPGLPPRVRALAADLTRDRGGAYDRAVAIEDWLADNTAYTLVVDPAPEGADVVEHFLFTSRRGWCEPIATSAVVLLRAAGVPARYATGFQPGTRNALTGRWTVRSSDAHAWAEVWVPGHGWTAFDATRAVPAALDPQARAPSIPLLAALEWAGERLRDLLPAQARGALLGAPGRAAAVSLVVFAAVLVAALAWLRHLRRRSASPSPFTRLGARAAAAGVPREAWQTPREYSTALRHARPDLPAGALATLLADEEHRRYDPGAPPPPADSEAALTELTAALSAGRRAWTAHPPS